MKVLAFAASLRAGSWNRKLIALAAEAAREHGADVDLADFHEFDMPLYDGDVETGQGIPPGCQELVRRLEAADAFMISTPEYNFGYPGTLKNAIDWVSRVKPMPLKGHCGYLLSASISMIGGLRGLWQLRQPMEGLGAHLMPYMYSLPQADKAFDENGRLMDEKRVDSLSLQVSQFIEHAAALRHKGETASG